MNDWSNHACLGYIVAALQRKGWSSDRIKEVVGAVYFEFDFKTVEEAEEVYRNSEH